MSNRPRQARWDEQHPAIPATTPYDTHYQPSSLRQLRLMQALLRRGQKVETQRRLASIERHLRARGQQP